MKFVKRFIAVVFAAALGLALVQPIQAARLGDAICSNSADGIYEFVQNTGFTRDDVQQIVDQTTQFRALGFGTCDGSSVRGFYVDEDNTLGWFIFVGEDLYLVQFDALGTLKRIS